MDISMNVDVEITKNEIEEIITAPIEWGEDDELYDLVRYRLCLLLKEGEFSRDDIETDETVLERFVREGYEQAARELGL